MSSQSDEVFLVVGGDVRPLRSRPFKAGLFGETLEKALQTLIEKQPNILNGRQIEPGSDAPPRFALLRREMQVGDWSLDHLLVDQRGVLTFVEAKLLQNPEARRAVIGQILDYAAYASENWSNGRLRQLAAEYWTGREQDVDGYLADQFPGIDIETFWKSVEANLARNIIRLIIAADELRPEVRRVIEFLNQQLKTIQVFGLEIRCYGEDPDAVIVPFLVGQNQEAATQKTNVSGSRNWTTEELREAYTHEPEPLGRRMTVLLDWAIQHHCIALPGDTKRPVFGISGHKGRQIISISPAYIYPMLGPDRYPSPSDRDRLANELQKAGFYSADVDVSSIGDGKNLSKRLDQMSDQEFSELLRILGGHCGSMTSLP